MTLEELRTVYNDVFTHFPPPTFLDVSITIRDKNGKKTFNNVDEMILYMVQQKRKKPLSLKFKVTDEKSLMSYMTHELEALQNAIKKGS